MEKVNVMRDPTWLYTKLNYSKKAPSLNEKKAYKNFESSNEENKSLDEIFKEKNYGLSKDFLKENKEFNNLDIYRDVYGEKDLEFINLNLDENSNQLVNKIDINAKKGSKSSFLINFSQTKGESSYLNSLIRVNLEDDSFVKLVVVVDLLENSLNLQQISSISGDRANFDISYIELGSDKSYVNIRNFLDGEESNLEENGVYFKQNEDFLDIGAFNDHKAKVTKSNCMFNGALKGKAEKRWKGVVDLKRGCEHADGKIGDYAVMLSPDAINRSAPVLLNEEKDVAGEHAASVGRFDKAMLFYIMSRGFSKRKAESLMLEANFAPTIDKIDHEELREKVRYKVHAMNTRD
ncbi:SufD family Fe-S cluster assembly protein [Anaerococcus vaginalis]|uniref:SufD family Fe-S cluster assembly protein n=1 Tax=Anaerococcus vaginalis TaxID=33037 RepID=UPI002903332A|nr:SufD family Fe-S cluster assembly protein [Anaerococcus vaginalis]MDU2374997.1 SufD family Fe-S cluster assembly protein [Anaerococcus vaginalis]